MDTFDGNTYRKTVLKPLLDEAPAELDPFGVLAIAPDEDHQAVIERRVAEVVAFWRREQNSARYRALVTRLLDEREPLIAAVTDPVRRAAAREAARDRQAVADRERVARLDRMLERLVEHHPGGVPRSRLDRLRALAARDGIPADQLAARLATVAVVDDTVEPLPEPDRARIRSLLAAYNQLAATERAGAGARPMRSLFDVLGVEPTAPDGVVREHHGALASRNRQRRHDRLRTVTDELLVLADRHAHGPGRARYQATLVAEARRELAPDIEAMLLVEDRIRPPEFEHLVREAVALGLDAVAARAAVIAAVADLGGAVETGAAVDYLLCPACGAVEAAGGRRDCRRCGTALYRSCPACGREIEASAHVCVHCGADLRALAEAERERHLRLQEAQQLAGVERERALAALVADHPGFAAAAQALAATPPAPPPAVEALGGIDGVVLRWEPSASPGVTGYRVTRLDPDGRGRLVGRTQQLVLEDGGVRTGDSVRYEVVAVRGEQVSAPAEVGAVAGVRLVMTADDREIRLRADPPAPGGVQVIRTTAQPPAPGTRLAPPGLAALGPALPRAGEPGSVADLVAGGPRWYVPVAVAGGGAEVAGPAVGHPGVAPVRDLTVREEPDHLLVRWTWPDGCTEAQVSWQGPGGAGQAKVTNMKYEIDGGFRLPERAPGTVEIAVAPGARLGRELVWAPPTGRVRYERTLPGGGRGAPPA